MNHLVYLQNISFFSILENTQYNLQKKIINSTTKCLFNKNVQGVNKLSKRENASREESLFIVLNQIFMRQRCLYLKMKPK